tara:strand:+ start:1200 stop:1595 length:396 start_codon:yes stop_codon:yes gene_type:complete
MLTSLGFLNKTVKERYLNYERGVYNIKDKKEKYEDVCGNVVNFNPTIYKVSSATDDLMMIMSVLFVFIEIFIIIYLLTVVWESYSGMERVLHLVLLLLYPAPYLFFLLFLSSPDVKSRLSKKIGGNQFNFA